MSKKKDPTDKGKVNFSDYFFLNVNNPSYVLLTISLKGLLIKTARINDVKPFNLNTTTNAKEVRNANYFKPRRSKTVMTTILNQGGIK